MAELHPRQIIYPIQNLSRLGDDSAPAERDFNERLSQHFQATRRVTPLGRARTGIYLLVAHSISGERRRIVMSPYTIPDVVNMVILAGGVPVFVDFLPNSTNVAAESVEAAIDDRTAAVMLTHYHVNQANLSEIAAICAARDVRLFDDCAISFGSQFKGAPVGALTDASVMSFSAFKILNFLWGGALSVKSDLLFSTIDAETQSWPRLKLLQYRRQALKTLAYGFATSQTIFPLVFRVRRPVASGDKIGDVFPLSRVETVSLDATIRSRPHNNALREWNRKFEAVEQRVAHRRRIAGIYDQYFRASSVSAETADELRDESCFINYPIVVGEDRRDQIYRDMLRSGLDIGRSLYPNVHEVESFTGIEGVSGNVSGLVRSVLTLPTHSRIREDYAHRLARRLSAAISTRRG